jgi:hypothetical protein
MHSYFANNYYSENIAINDNIVSIFKEKIATYAASYGFRLKEDFEFRVEIINGLN